MRMHSFGADKAIALLLAVTVSSVFSAYMEGIDTTDNNGYCRDSLFHISNDRIVQDTGKKMISYSASSFSYGYFPVAFEDIYTAPDSFRYCTQLGALNFPYVIYTLKNSLYSKVFIASKLADGRYVYRFGRNTVAGNQLLINNIYNPAVRYKPENLYFTIQYIIPRTQAHLIWEPPLPGNNHLLGYICYFSKLGAVIDTTKPVNLSQWDSVAYTTANELTIDFRNGYLNLVAVYQEGKSDFLDGWLQMPLLMGISQSISSHDTYNTCKCSIRKTTAGYCFNFFDLPENIRPLSAAIYLPSGRLMARISGMQQGNEMIWNAVKNPKGLFIAKFAFSDGSVAEMKLLGGE